MELTLSNLRHDYKLVYKVQPETAVKIVTLIEYLKICQDLFRPEELPARRIKVLALCYGIGISERTLYRWKAAYIKNGFVGLTNKRAKGRKAQELSNSEKNLIRDMRAKYRWGSEVIQAHLKYDHQIEISKFRIERFLTLSGVRDKYPCTTKKRKQKIKNEHKRVVKIHRPGDHMQLDTKHLPRMLENGKKCYVFNIVDHASNWSYKRAYSTVSAKSTVDFMKRVIKACPFGIRRVQTDNGTEFTGRFYKRYVDSDRKHPFEVYLKKQKIEHKLIPPGKKELQGLVERSHRQDDQEFYITMEPLEINEFNYYLENYFKQRNKYRRFKKLDWRTPEEWLKEYKRMQLVLSFGHKYRPQKHDSELLPNLKIDPVAKPTKQLTLVKNDLDVSSGKEEEKNDDIESIKKVA